MSKKESAASSAVLRYSERDLRRMIGGVTVLEELTEAKGARMVLWSGLDNAGCQLA